MPKKKTKKSKQNKKDPNLHIINNKTTLTEFYDSKRDLEDFFEYVLDKHHPGGY